VPITPKTTNKYVHNVQREAKIDDVEEKYQDIGFSHVLDETLIRYCEAVVHPFGNESIGATLPDRYQELVIPLTDRLELDLTPDLFNYPGSSADWTNPANGVQLTAIFIWFQPRSVGAGLINQDLGTAINPVNTAPFLTVDEDFSSVSSDEILNAYNLCITGVWDNTTAFADPVTFGLFNGDASGLGTYIVQNYIAISYSRFSNIVSNCNKIRVLGAGIKAWSEEAPINTGGYAVGGWITLEDIYEAIAINTLGPIRPGALKTIQPSIKFACRSPGVKGSTTRYSTLQTAEQVEPEYPIVPDRMFTVAPNPNVTSPFIINPNIGADLGIHDILTPGSYVPCIFWQFNTTDNESSTRGVYTVKLMSLVHSEGTPTGSSPFMSNKSNYDPAVEQVKMMLENPEIFPPAVKGHSFKSFMKKTRHVVAKIARFAGKTQRIMALADQFFNI
jgi:hypothetical protein